MSNTPIQSPLGINVLGSLLKNTGLNINPVFSGRVGTSISNSNYTYGTILNNTILNKITTAINLAYSRTTGNVGGDITPQTYKNLLSIGKNTIPALGNTSSNTYLREIIATSTSNIDNTITVNSTANFEVGDQISFDNIFDTALNNTTFYFISEIIDYTTFTISSTNGGVVLPLNGGTGNMIVNNYSIDRYGFIRKLALQGYTEFNINNALPKYNTFLDTFSNISNYIESNNELIYTLNNSKTFLDGVYSNMNDLITGDITGVNIATQSFGRDLIDLGKALDLESISTFGLPSNLLNTLKNTNSITPSLNLAILMSGINESEYDQILNDISSTTDTQQRYLYSAFNIIVGEDLLDILVPLNCKTSGLDSLADLLNIKKMFPRSFNSMTVPVYNDDITVTNSKTYYNIFDNNGVNTLLSSYDVVNKIPATIPTTIPKQIEPTEFSLSELENIIEELYIKEE